MDRKHEAVTREITVSAATSGNHGRDLAWGARMFGCRCVIYMNDGVSAGREEAIAAYGAEVVRMPGSYDRTVQRSYEDAERLGYFPISDEKSSEYPTSPGISCRGTPWWRTRSSDSAAATGRPRMSLSPEAGVAWPLPPAGTCGSGTGASIRGWWSSSPPTPRASTTARSTTAPQP